jgi:hypothetical protein
MSGSTQETESLSAIEPFSLYLELEPGLLADLEAISKIGLALSIAIKEAAFILDPSITLRLEIVRGREGSFSFDTFLRVLNVKDALARVNLKTLAVGCLIWFGGQSAEYTYQKIIDYMIDSPVTITEADKNDIAKKVYLLLNQRIAEDKIQNVYKVMHSESSISGVGAALNHGIKPTYIVPRSEFIARSGVRTESEVKSTSRIRENEEILTLISPVLLESSPRRWRLKGTEGEFGAVIKDEAFLKSLAHGHVKVQMASNIRFVVILQTKEDFDGVVWKIKERNITKILRIIPPDIQGDLTLFSPSP